jgi:multiple sugar transport system substrate-binding protein
MSHHVEEIEMFQQDDVKRSPSTISRRQFLKATAAIGIATPILAACTAVPAAPAAAPAGEAAPSTSVADVTYWDMVWGPPEYVDTAKKLADQYNASQGNYKVTYQSTPWSNWYQTFLTAIGSGTAPDISTGAGYQSVFFYDQGAIAPIDDVIDDLKAAGKIDDSIPGSVETLKWDDHYVSIPWNTDIRTAVYRKDLLEQAGISAPPKNWSEFAEQTLALTKDDKYGWVVQGNDTGGTHILFMLMFNNDGGWFTPDRQVDTFYDRNVEAIQFFSDVVKSGAVHPGSAGFTGDDALKVFTEGDAAYYIAGPNVASRVPDGNGDVGLPLASPHDTFGTISWINNRMIYEQSKQKDGAKDFMKWMFDNELPLFTEGHCDSFPTRTTFFADPYFTERPHVKNVLDNWIPIGKPSGYRYPSIFPELQTVEGDAFMFTLLTDLLQGKDVNESLTKVDTALKGIMEG